MSERQYIDIIKNMISGKANIYSETNLLTPSFFHDFFNNNIESIQMVIKAFNLNEIDITVLQRHYELALREYLSVNPIDIYPSNILSKKGYKTWLTLDRENSISWNYSERYFSYMDTIGRSKKVITETRNSSLTILERIGDPKSENPFYYKGLVVGSVQSGKTANFNAVINRAIDAGYALVIIFSGIMEDLRSQTQLRIENDVIGSGVIDLVVDRKGDKGVGKVRRFGVQGDSAVEQAISITSYKSDFKKALVDADFSLNRINLLVCKKNISVLKNLIFWLDDYLEENKDKHNIPLLVLDDEADNASLNNEGAKGREYASKINGHIRVLLNLFQKKSYLGYTATPFANVLQDRNDEPVNKYIIPYIVKGESREKAYMQVPNIFPDDFIVLLNPPSNYIGAKEIFETITPIKNKADEKIPLIEIVDDYISELPSRVYRHPVVGVENYLDEDQFKLKGGYSKFQNYQSYKELTRSSSRNDDFPKALPTSLEESIICFILTIAIRESRKNYIINSSVFNPHHSMLIHVSRFTNWQDKTKILVNVFIKKIQSDLDNDNPTKKGSIYELFEKIWLKYYMYITSNIYNYLPEDYVDEFLLPVTYKKIMVLLPSAVRDIEVKAINSSKDSSKLEYQWSSPKKVIAIGGNRLSRGFTLEGLTINYFIRSTNYSDTLLQMGRWFGYRPGYLDCCKLFTTQDSIDKFDSTTRVIEELESEFRKMEDKGKSPQDFILRVRKHPGTLKITRPSIMKNTIEVKWSYQDQLVETTTFNITKDKINNVWLNFKNNIAGRYNFENLDNNFFIHKTDINSVIGILKNENNFEEVTCSGIIKFLEICQKKGKLLNWTIAIKRKGDASPTKGKGKLTSAESNLPREINLAIRRGPKLIDGESPSRYRTKFLNDKVFCASGKSAHIISSNQDLSILLEDHVKLKAEEKFRQEFKEKLLEKDNTLTESEALAKAFKVTIPERVYREQMSDQEGLFIIYLFDSYYVFRQEKGEEDKDFRKIVNEKEYNLDIPLVGYALGFPPIEPDPGGVYVKGDYDLEIDEGDDEGNDLDSQLPEDLNAN